MKKDLFCPYSILDREIICEHKLAPIPNLSTVTVHNHDGYEFILFLDGECDLFVESEEKNLSRGDFVIIPPFAFHGITLGDTPNYERIVINLRPSFFEAISDDTVRMDEIFSKYDTKQMNVIHFDETQLAPYLTLLDKASGAGASGKYGDSLLLRAYLTEFFVSLIQLSRQDTSEPYENIMSPVIRKIFTYIDQNIKEPITVESMASDLHHNSEYLGRVFKNKTGLSLKHYINAKKITLAQQYLSQGYSPYDICFMIGFSNYSSFSRCFSLYVGLSPKQYQKSCNTQSES